MHQWKHLRLSSGLRAELTDLFLRGMSLAQALEFRQSSTVQIALPPHVDPMSAVTSLRNGGVCGLGPAINLLVATIERYLRAGTDHVVVLQDVNARLGDEVLERSRLDWRDVDGEIYYLLTRDAGGDQIEVAVRKAMDVYSFFCAFTKCGESASQIPVGRETLEHWARETTTGILGVCDGETFVLFSAGPITE